MSTSSNDVRIHLGQIDLGIAVVEKYLNDEYTTEQCDEESARWYLDLALKNLNYLKNDLK